ncbi:unnamed protein product [Amoebophrya sp. A120]|nr:unnamed protein product [Amoebophrya sp. A120]|eukprot:GSA120T00006472001.1
MDSGEVGSDPLNDDVLGSPSPTSSTAHERDRPSPVPQIAGTTEKSSASNAHHPIPAASPAPGTAAKADAPAPGRQRSSASAVSQADTGSAAKEPGLPGADAGAMELPPGTKIKRAPKDLPAFGGILQCPVCWQLFQNYMDLDEDEQLRKSASNPLRSPFARLLRREQEERKDAQCSRVLCAYHKDAKRKYDIGLHRKKLEGAGRRLAPKELKQISRLTASATSDPSKFVSDVLKYVEKRFKRMLAEVESSLAQDSEMYKQQWYEELLETKKTVQKQVTEIGEKWNVYLNEEKALLLGTTTTSNEMSTATMEKVSASRHGATGAAAASAEGGVQHQQGTINTTNANTTSTTSKSRMHFSTSMLDFFALEETLQKAKDYDALDRLQKLAEAEERNQRMLFKKEQEKSEQRKIEFLTEKVQTSFTAQRDRLFGRIQRLAVQNEEKELKIDRRIAVVTSRLKLEQSREISVVRLLFQEHCTRIEHFVAHAGGKRTEQFQPFAVLDEMALNANEEEQEGEFDENNPDGAGGPNASRRGKKAPPVSGPAKLYTAKSFTPFLTSAEEKSRDALPFEPSPIFEFASKVLCEEMRILEHRKISMPDISTTQLSVSSNRNKSVSKASEQAGENLAVASSAQKNDPQQASVRRSKSAASSSVARMMREKKEGYDPILSQYNAHLMNELREQKLQQRGRGMDRKWNSVRPLSAARPDTKVVRNDSGDLFSKSYTELFTKKDVYIAHPNPPPISNRPECAACGTFLERTCVIRDVVNEKVSRPVARCCSWKCCKDWNDRYSPPFLRLYRESYIEEQEIRDAPPPPPAKPQPKAYNAEEAAVSPFKTANLAAAAAGSSSGAGGADEQAGTREEGNNADEASSKGGATGATSSAEEREKASDGENKIADEDAAAPAAVEQLPESLTDRHGNTIKPVGPPEEPFAAGSDLMEEGEGGASSSPAASSPPPASPNAGILGDDDEPAEEEEEEEDGEETED